MADIQHLAPNSTHSDPFATPSRHSEANYEYEDPGHTSGWAGAPPSHPMEVQDNIAAYGSSASKPTFMQRWKNTDQRMYGATIGSLGAGRKRSGGEKELAATAGTRRRRPALCCSIILGFILLIVIIAIVVPIAVVFSNKHTASSSTSSSGSSGSVDTLQPQNAGVMTVQNGQYQGSMFANGISAYLGMQYAAPPTGDLRFAAPQPPNNFTGVLPATKYCPGCIGLGTPSAKEGEDCLYLDVYTPTNATKNSKLPVFLFMQGGGLQDSATHFNGSSLITASGLQIITVFFTYRVNAFGFLASKELQANGSLNIGLKDQRQAMKWVQKNIAEFGGDPSHVVLGGQSGGAGSAVQHLAAYGGRDDKLFQAVAMQSQSLQPVRDVSSSQYQYDYIVGNTSCSGQTDTLSCLRQISVTELIGAITNSPFPNGAGGDPVFPYNPVIDNDFVTEYPIDAFSRGHFVNVPMIFGDVTDEGTIFVSQGERKSIQTVQDSDDYLRNTFPKINSTMLSKYSSLYNFTDTGSSDYWTQVSTAYGETRYTCPGIQLSNYAAKNNSGKIWNYHYDVMDPTAEAKGNGVPHSSEMGAIFGAGGAAASYQNGQENANAIPLMQGYWTSFIKHFDPNTDKEASAPTWEAWKGSNRIHITTNTTAMEDVDADQANRCSYLNSIASAIGQ